MYTVELALKNYQNNVIILRYHKVMTEAKTLLRQRNNLLTSNYPNFHRYSQTIIKHTQYPLLQKNII